ncbi:hypothetical protein HYC85_023911 [Camellia sinensis]|uniref:Uncharacterized protein n=1 Tax=Camellia sinensis TaxID=4442 RepID=A0A7J7GFU9_CAMSI|nr:hypothetical protein HYC85_023911 [Camellia sinensis]
MPKTPKARKENAGSKQGVDPWTGRVDPIFQQLILRFCNIQGSTLPRLVSTLVDSNKRQVSTPPSQVSTLLDSNKRLVSTLNSANTSRNFTNSALAMDIAVVDFVRLFIQSIPDLSVYMIRCDNGCYGIDCTIPFVLSVIRDWPQWLRPVQVDIPDSPQDVGNLVNLNAVVEKKRPLIYVYDLPSEFNNLLHEVSMCNTCEL